MAQSADSATNSQKEVVIKIGGGANNEFHTHQQPQQQTKNAASLASLKGCEQENELAGPKLTQPPHQEELLNIQGGGQLDNQEAAEDEAKNCSSGIRSQRNARTYTSTQSARLQDPNWRHETPRLNSNGKTDDSFLDEDFLGINSKKLSPLTLVQLVALVLIMAALAFTLPIAELKTQTLWDLPLWKWEILILVFVCGHLFSGWGVRIIVFFIECNFLLKLRVLYFVYGMRKAVQYCLWLGLVLLAWHSIVAEKIERKTRSKVLPCVKKILVCLLVGMLIWLVKILMVKILASNFHTRTYFERIKVTLFKLHVIKKLRGDPSAEEQSDTKEKESMDASLRKDPKLTRVFYKLQYNSNPINNLHKLTKENVSALRMKRLITLVQGGVLSNLSTLDEGLSYSSDEEETPSHVTADGQEASKIFLKVAQGKTFISLTDLKRFMSEDEASRTMELFKEPKKSEGISRASFTEWMADASEERRDLALSLKDTRTAVDELRHMSNVIVAIVILLIWLLIFGLHVTHFLVLISTQFLLVVFIFGNTCRTVFEAIVFLFIMHPFDVGDRCEVDAVQMVVDEMNILTTVFLRHDNQKIIYPNSVLATKPISNYRRSPHMGDAIEFSIHISTQWDKILRIKEKIKEYVKKRVDHWYSESTVMVKDVEDMNRLKMIVWVKHKMNHHDMEERWTRRALLVEEMIKIFRELEVEYRMLPLDLNVRNMASWASDRLPSIWRTCAEC